MGGIGNSGGTSFVYHKNVLLTYNTLIEIQFNKKLSWEDVSIEQHEKKMVNTRMIYSYKRFRCRVWIELPLELTKKKKKESHRVPFLICTFL